MMQPGAADSGGYPHHPHHHAAHHHHQMAHMHHHHPAAPMPMDLHVPQAFPYYRYRNDALCWTDRKAPVDDITGQGSVNARILELRKEKSRDAARSRRGKENYEFYELAKMLPLPGAITSQLDKASIIRLTISYLRLREFSGHGEPPWNSESSRSSSTASSNKNVAGKGSQVRPRSVTAIAMEIFEQHQGTHILQSLDGFAFALAADGRFLYISETVSIYLGLSQVEMTGSSVFDYIHQQDHAELAEHLGLSLSTSQNLASPPSSAASDDGVNSSSTTGGTQNPDVATAMTISSSSPYKGLDRAFCIRMKSTLTKRGCHFKSSGYRVVLVLCCLRPQMNYHNRKWPPTLMGVVALAIALPPPSVHEIRLESDMFVTRLTFDFRVAHCEPRISELLDYTAEEITGRNLYGLCHGEDVNNMRKFHIDLINKGQVMSQYYRLMNKNGGFTWVQTCATVVCNTKNAEEQSIICVNYIISGCELEHVVMDCCQMGDAGLPPTNVKREETASSSGDEPDDRSSPSHQHHNNNDSSSSSSSSSSTAENNPSHGQHHKRDSGSGGGGNTGSKRAATLAVKPVDVHDDNNNSGGGGGGGDIVRRRHLQRKKPALIRQNSDDDEDDDDVVLAAVQKRREGHKRVVMSDGSDVETNAIMDRVSAPAVSSSSPERDASVSSMPIPLMQPRTAPVCNKRKYMDDNDDSEDDDDDDDDLEEKVRGGMNGFGSVSERNNSDSSVSVRALESAMSKHLPSGNGDKESTVTDFSADSLLKQQQRSTIQWVGAKVGSEGNNTGSGGGNVSPYHSHYPHHQQTSTPPLPATALLRQLYANRESVIRTGSGTRSSSSQANSDSANASNPEASPTGSGVYFSPETNPVSGSGPTPPTADDVSAAAAAASSGPFEVSSASPFSAAAVAAAAAAAAFHASVTSMTPPSSVSPRDYVTGPTPAHHQYASDAPSLPAQPLPLKPHVYTATPMHFDSSQYANPDAYHHSHGAHSLSNHHHAMVDEQAQNMAHHHQQQQQQFYSSGNGGFHLYHPNPLMKNVTSPWYSTPS